jgi:hypothetical protein
MYRRISLLAVTGLTAATGLAVAAPAAAAVTYDPGTKTGAVDSADVRKAFGWTAAMLAARAGGVAFDHEFWTDDTYAVGCGGRTVPVVHHRDFGRYELSDVVVGGGGPRAHLGYAGSVTGFRLTGPSSGISGTSVAPAVGQPCPAGQGPAIDVVRLVSSATGWTLAVRSGDVRRELRVSRQPSLAISRLPVDSRCARMAASAAAPSRASTAVTTGSCSA